MNDSFPFAGRSRPRMRRGFTLFELMITIAIAAILMMVAAPSMLKTFKSNRIQSEASSFVSDLMLARAEAVKRGLGVSVCSSSDGSSCMASGNTWQAGWVVFLDSAAACSVPSSSPVIIKARTAFTGTDTLTGSSSSMRCVTFNREGFTSNLGASSATFTLHTADNLTTATRCVVVDLGGHVSTKSAGQVSSCS
jgi:type IV fimbrial biogenesis protein FimT